MSENDINFQEEIKKIHERNKRVEADKAWETSKFRILFICLITYVFASALLFLIGAENFLLGALVPVLGYFLSTQSLPAVKRWWVNNYFSKNK